MSKFNESEDSNIVGEIVCGVLGITASGVAAWFCKKNLPKIKEGFSSTKERLKSSIEGGIQIWKDYKPEPQPEKEEEKNPFEDTEETPPVEAKTPEPVVWIEVVPDTESVNPFDTSELPEIPPLAHTDKEFEKTVEKPASSKKQVALKKCSKNCGSVLQGKEETAVGICANCQSKMRCKSCNNQLRKEEWGSPLCVSCLNGTQCSECHARTPIGQKERHGSKCSKNKVVSSVPVNLEEQSCPLEELEKELEASPEVILAVCSGCGQMYSGVCENCPPAKPKRVRKPKAVKAE